MCTAAVILFQQYTLALDLPSLDVKPNGKVVMAWNSIPALGSNGIQKL